MHTVTERAFTTLLSNYSMLQRLARSRDPDTVTAGFTRFLMTAPCQHGEGNPWQSGHTPHKHSIYP